MGWEAGRPNALLRVLRPLRGLPLYLRRTLSRPASRRAILFLVRCLVLRQLQAGQRLKRAARLATQLSFQRGQVAPVAHLAAMFVHHTEVHKVVGCEHIDLDIGPHNVQRGGIAHKLQHRIYQTACAKLLRRIQRLGELGGGVGQRDQPAARTLVQRLNQRLHFFPEHAGHHPLGTLLIHLVQHKQRHGHGQSVACITRLVQVGGGTVHPAQADGFGERRRGDASGLVAHQLLARQAQERAVPVTTAELDVVLRLF